MFILVHKFKDIVCHNGVGCPGLLSIAVVKHGPEPTLYEERVFLKYPSHTLLGREMRAETQGRYVEAETETVMEECCSLSCSLWLFQHAYIYISGPPAKGVSSSPLGCTFHGSH